jgi:hypothetical protein
MATLTESGELNIGYKGKMFAQPMVKYTLVHVIPDGESPEEGKMIRAAYEKLWNAGMIKLKKERAATIKKAMDDTEKAIAKKPPANMEEFIATANKLIQQGLDVFRQVEIVRLAEECLSKVYDAVEKVLKKKITRQQAKTALKIVGLVLITLAVAAVSIAATVLTGGVMAAVVLAAIGVGVSAIVASGKIIKKEYDNYNGVIDKIKNDLADLKKAAAYQEKKALDAVGRKLGPKEKVKLFIYDCGPIIKRLKSSIMVAEGKMILLRNEFGRTLQKANETAGDLGKMSSINDTGVSEETKRAWVEAKKAEAAMNRAKAAMTAFKDNNAAFDELKVEAMQLIDRIEKNGKFEDGNINSLLAKAQNNSTAILDFLEAGMELTKAVADLADAIGK